MRNTVPLYPFTSLFGIDSLKHRFFSWFHDHGSMIWEVVRGENMIWIVEYARNDKPLHFFPPHLKIDIYNLFHLILINFTYMFTRYKITKTQAHQVHLLFYLFIFIRCFKTTFNTLFKLENYIASEGIAVEN